MKKNSKEGAGWKYIKRAVLKEEGGTASTQEVSVPTSDFNANDIENTEEGGNEETVETSFPPSSSNENENIEE